MTLEGVTDLKWPDINYYQPEGRKVMLLLLLLDIVNFKIKLVITVGF